MSDPSPIAPSDGAPVVPAASAPASWPLLLAIAAGVAAAGGIAGRCIGLSFAPSAPAKPARDPGAGPGDPVTPPRPLTKADLKKIDDLLLEGGHADALAQLGLGSPAGSKPTPDVAYRVALCLEQLGKPSGAAEYYRACLMAPSPHLRIASQLGLARSAMRDGKEDHAQGLLCGLLCRSGGAAFAHHPYRAEAMSLLALALARQCQGNPAPHATRPDALAWGTAALPPERYLRWGEKPPSAAVPPPPVPEQITVSASSDDPLGFRVTGRREQADLGGVLDRLAASAGLKAAWAEDARAAVAGRRVDLECDGASLAGLIDWLTAPHGVLAEHGEKKLTFRLIEGHPAARREHALRGLRAALALAGDHPAAGDLFLAMGNLHAAAGRWQDAAGWYERLAREHPRADALTASCYNLGLARLARGNAAGAREAFYRNIDQAPAHPLAPLAYWWVARSHLDEKDLDGALTPLRRARGHPAAASTAPAAALGLVIRDILKGQPGQALDLLRERRAVLREGPFARPAAVLAAFAHTRLPADDARKDKEASAELLGVALSQDGDWLGTAFRYIRGQALRELGLHEEMVALHDGAAPESNPLVREMRLRSAEALIQQAARARARPRLERLAAGKDVWGRRARLALAELDLRDGQSDRCLQRCRDLLIGEHGDRGDVLTVMSRAYAARRDFARAAEALAGQGAPQEAKR